MGNQIIAADYWFLRSTIRLSKTMQKFTIILSKNVTRSLLHI